MFEKEAEEYTQEKAKQLGINNLNLVYHAIQIAYRKGAELGYNKANEWHDLRKDPTDIPPIKDDIYSIEVWAKDERGNYGTAMFSYACFRDDGKYNHWIGTKPIAWTELTKFEE